MRAQQVTSIGGIGGQQAPTLSLQATTVPAVAPTQMDISGIMNMMILMVVMVMMMRMMTKATEKV
jgi:hypothetical protein